jgi:hypothetical protein
MPVFMVVVSKIADNQANTHIYLRLQRRTGIFAKISENIAAGILK